MYWPSTVQRPPWASMSRVYGPVLLPIFNPGGTPGSAACSLTASAAVLDTLLLLQILELSDDVSSGAVRVPPWIRTPKGVKGLQVKDNVVVEGPALRQVVRLVPACVRVVLARSPERSTTAT